MLRLPLTGPPLGLPFVVNRASPQAVGLASWWPSNAYPHGQPRDLAGTNHGTRSGAVAWTVDTFGQVLNFPGGGSDYVALTNQDFTRITVAAWVWNNPSNDGGFNHILGKHPDWFLSHGGSSGIRFNVNGAAEAFCTSGYTGVDSVWSHIAATYDGANIVGYLNGVQTGSPTAYSGAIGTGGTMRMGAYGGGGFNWTGKMADVRVYNRALSAAEVWSLWAPQTRWDLYLVTPFAVAPSIAPPAALGAMRMPLLGVG